MDTHARTTAVPAASKSAAADVSGTKAVSKRVTPDKNTRVRATIDRPFLIVAIILICLGSIMVFSSSYATALSRKGDSFYYVKRDLIFVIMGMVALFFASRVDYLVFRKVAPMVYLVAIFLLVLVLTIGAAKGEAQRWIGFGSFTLQPSEVAKFALVLMLARFISDNQRRINDYKDFWQSSFYGTFAPLFITAVPCGLVALESHFSGTIIMFLIGMLVIFASGSRIFWLAAFSALGAIVITPFIFLTGYSSARIQTWLHPEEADLLTDGWQTVQGLNAIGSGGLFGVGLGNSSQKHLFVSEPQNDFIFSIICEELGFIGALVILALFGVLIWRGFVIAMRAPDTFSSLLVIGLVGKITIQLLLNICVVTNLIPNTGIALPFFSYGGSAKLMQLGEVGIILSVSRYSYLKKQ